MANGNGMGNSNTNADDGLRFNGTPVGGTYYDESSGLYQSRNPVVAEGLNLLADGRNLAALPAYIEEEITSEVIKTEKVGNPLIQDLLAQGLFKPYPNWVRKTKYTQNKSGGGVNAWMSMDPDVRGERGKLDLKSMSWPIPVTGADFSEGYRTIQTYNNSFEPYDASYTAEATIAINQLIEDVAWNGWNQENSTTAMEVGGVKLPGLFSNPVNNYDYTGSNPAWTHASKTGSEIEADVQAMADVLTAQMFPGPYTLWVNTAYNSKLNRRWTDGTTTFDKNIRQALEEMDFNGTKLRIKTSTKIPANKVIMIQYTTNVIEVLLGQSPSLVSWISGNGFRYFWMLVACVVPLVKSDYAGNQGYVVGDIP